MTNNDETAEKTADCSRSSDGQSIGFLIGLRGTEKGDSESETGVKGQTEPNQNNQYNRAVVLSQPRPCRHCGRSFTPHPHKRNRKNAGQYCSRRCAAHAPRPMQVFGTPESTKAQRIRANGLINKRIKLGWFERPERCTQCGLRGKTDAHHDDYSKPDQVQFLCRSCHMKRHVALGKQQQEVA